MKTPCFLEHVISLLTLKQAREFVHNLRPSLPAQSSLVSSLRLLGSLEAGQPREVVCQHAVGEEQSFLEPSICFLLPSKRGRECTGAIVPPTGEAAGFAAIRRLQERGLQSLPPLLLIHPGQFLGCKPGPEHLIGSRCSGRALELPLRFLGPSATGIDRGEEIVRSSRLENRPEAVARKWQPGDFHPQVFPDYESIRAASVARQCEQLLEFHLDPNLADIGSTFFTWKKSVMKQALGALKIFCFRKIEDQFEDQAGRSVRKVRILL